MLAARPFRSWVSCQPTGPHARRVSEAVAVAVSCGLLRPGVSSGLGQAGCQPVAAVVARIAWAEQAEISQQREVNVVADSGERESRDLGCDSFWVPPSRIAQSRSSGVTGDVHGIVTRK
jgi:hypothetical protein